MKTRITSASKKAATAILPAMLLLGVMFFVTPLVWADQATDYLKKVDQMLNPGQDMTAVIKTVLISTSGKTEDRVMKTYRKGQKKIFFFRSPAGVKGVAFLSLADDQMYLYMPAFKKVRRIASSAKNENFMGTDMSYEDLAETSYASKYNSKLVSENETEVVLELTAKSDANTAYSKLVMTIDKKTWVRKSVDMYAKSGKLWKKMIVPSIKIIGGYATPVVIKITDVQSGHATKLVMGKVKYDKGLKDSLFSKRKIKRIK